MTDRAHEATDKRLARLERQLQRRYQKAKKEVLRMAESYFAEFEKADDQMRKKFDAGEITSKQYKEWRKKKMLRGKSLKDLKERVSALMLRTNQEASELINREMQTIYTENYNGTAEHNIAGFDTIDIPSEEAAKRLPHREMDEKKDTAWNRYRTEAGVVAAIMAGLLFKEMAEEVSRVAMENFSSMRRAAVTMVTSAENMGRADSFAEVQRIVGDGRRVRKRWHTVGDDRVRHAHRQMDGIDIPLGAAFVNSAGVIMQPGDMRASPQNVYNCRCWIEIVIRDIGTS